MPSFGLPVRWSAPSLLLVLVTCALCRLSGSTAAVADPRIRVCQHRVEGQSIMYGQQQAGPSVFLDQARVAAGTKAGRLRKLNTYYSPEGCVTGVKPVYASGAAVSQLIGMQHGMKEKSLELSANETVNRADISYDSRCIRYIRWYTNSSRNATVGSQQSSTTSKLAIATPADPQQHLMAFKGRLDSAGALAQIQLVWGEAMCMEMPASVAAPALVGVPAALPADVPVEPTPTPALALQPAPPTASATVQQLSADPSGKEQLITPPSVQSQSVTEVKPAATNTTAAPKQTATANAQGLSQVAATTVREAEILAALQPAAALPVDPHKRSPNVTQQVDAVHVGLNGSSSTAAAAQSPLSVPVGSSAPASADPANSVKLPTQSDHPATNATSSKQALSASLSSAGSSLLNFLTNMVDAASAASSEGSVPATTASSGMRVAAAGALQGGITGTAAAVQSTSSMPIGSSAPDSVAPAASVKLDHPATNANGHKQPLGTSASPAFSSLLGKVTDTARAASSEGSVPVPAANSRMRVAAGLSQGSTPAAQVPKRADPVRSALNAIGGFAKKLFGGKKSDAQAADSSKTRFQSMFDDEDDDSAAEVHRSKAASWPAGMKPDLGNTLHQPSVTAASRGKGKAMDSSTRVRLQQQQQSPTSQPQQQQQPSVTVASRNRTLDSSKPAGSQQQHQSPDIHSQPRQTSQQQRHTRQHRRQGQQQADAPEQIIMMKHGAAPGNKSHTVVAAAADTATHAAGNHGNKPSNSSSSRFNSSSSSIGRLVQQRNEPVDCSQSQRLVAQQITAAQSLTQLQHNSSKAKATVPTLTNGSHPAIPLADSMVHTGSPRSPAGTNAADQPRAHHPDAQQDSHLKGNAALVGADDRSPAVTQQTLMPLTSKGRAAAPTAEITTPTTTNNTTAAAGRLALDHGGLAAPGDYSQNSTATKTSRGARSTPDKRSKATASVGVGLNVRNNTPDSSLAFLDQEVIAVPAGDVAVLHYLGLGNSTNDVAAAETNASASEPLKHTSGNATSVDMLVPAGGNETQQIQPNTTADMSLTRDVTSNNASTTDRDLPQMAGAAAGAPAAVGAAHASTAQQGGNLSFAAPVKMTAVPAAESKAAIEPLAMMARPLNATQSGLTGEATVNSPAASTVLTSHRNNSTTATGSATAIPMSASLSTSGLAATAPLAASWYSDRQLTRDGLWLATLTQNSTDGATHDDVQVDPTTPPAAAATAAADTKDTAGTTGMRLPPATAVGSPAVKDGGGGSTNSTVSVALTPPEMTAAAAAVAPRNLTAATDAVVSAAGNLGNLTTAAAAQSPASSVAKPEKLTSATDAVPLPAAKEPSVIISQRLNASEAPTAAASLVLALAHDTTTPAANAALQTPAEVQESVASNVTAATAAVASTSATGVLANVSAPTSVFYQSAMLPGRPPQSLVAEGALPATSPATLKAKAAEGSSPAVAPAAAPAAATEWLPLAIAPAAVPATAAVWLPLVAASAAVPAKTAEESLPAVAAAAAPALAVNGSPAAAAPAVLPALAGGKSSPAAAAAAVPAAAVGKITPAVAAATVPAPAAEKTTPAVAPAAVPAPAAEKSSPAAAAAALPAPAGNKTSPAVAATALPAPAVGKTAPAVVAAAVLAAAANISSPAVAAPAVPAPAANVSSTAVALAGGRAPPSEGALPAEVQTAKPATSSPPVTNASVPQQATSQEPTSTAQVPATQTTSPSVVKAALTASTHAATLHLGDQNASRSAVPGIQHTYEAFSLAPVAEESPTPRPSAAAEPAPAATAMLAPPAAEQPAPALVADVTPSAAAKSAPAAVADLTPSVTAAQPAPPTPAEPAALATSGLAPSQTPPETPVSVGDNNDTLAWRLFDDLLQDATAQGSAEEPMPAAAAKQPIATAAEDSTTTRQVGLTHLGEHQAGTQQPPVLLNQPMVKMSDNDTHDTTSQSSQHQHHHHHQQQRTQKADNITTAVTAEGLPSADATKPANTTTAAAVVSTPSERQDSNLQQRDPYLQQQQRKTHRKQMQDVQGQHDSIKANLPAASGFNLTGNLTMELPGQNHSGQQQQHQLHHRAKPQQLQQDKNTTHGELHQPSTTSQNATSRPVSHNPAAKQPADLPKQQQQQQQRPIEQLQQLWAKWQQHHNATNSTGLLAQLPANTAAVPADTDLTLVQAVLQPDNVTFDAHTQASGASQPNVLKNQSQASHLRAGPPAAAAVINATAVTVAAPPMALLTLLTSAAQGPPPAAASGAANSPRAQLPSRRLASPHCQARPAMCDAMITTPSHPAYCPVAAPFTTPQCVGGCCVSAGKCSSSDCTASGLGRGLPHMMCRGLGSYGGFGYDPSGDTVCRHLACRLAVPGCMTGATDGNCVGKLVSLSTADQLHPEGLRLLGSPCLEAMPGDAPLTLDGTSSQQGEFIARLWSVCDCQAEDTAIAAAPSNAADVQPGKNSSRSDTALQGMPAWLQLLGLTSNTPTLSPPSGAGASNTAAPTQPGPTADAYALLQQQPGSVATAAPSQAGDAPPAAMNQQGLSNMRLPDPATTSQLYSSPTTPTYMPGGVLSTSQQMAPASSPGGGGGGGPAAAGQDPSNAGQPLGDLADVLLGIGRVAAAALIQGNGSSAGSSAAVSSNPRVAPATVAAGNSVAPDVAPSVGLGQLAAAALAALQNSTARASTRNSSAGSTSRGRGTAGSGAAPSPATADNVEEDYDDGVIRSGRYKGYISSRGAAFSHSSNSSSSPGGTSSSSSSNSSGDSSNSSAAGQQHTGASPEASPASSLAAGNMSTAGAEVTGIRSTGMAQPATAQFSTAHHGGHGDSPAANASAASLPSRTAAGTPHLSTDNPFGDATGGIVAPSKGLQAMVDPNDDTVNRTDGLLGGHGLPTGLVDAQSALPEGNSSSRMPATQSRWQAADAAPDNTSTAASNITTVANELSSSNNSLTVDDSLVTASPGASIALRIPDGSRSTTSSNSAALGNQQQEQIASLQEGAAKTTEVKGADRTNSRVHTGSAAANRRLLIIRQGSKLR